MPRCVTAIVDTPEEAAGLDLPPLLVRRPLEAFLDERGLGNGPVDAETVGEGHSNVTYVIRRGDESWVLRRPPRPPLPPSAHDVLREARLLRAVDGTTARTPKVLATCDDEAVIGAPFYVMERLDGDVITRKVPPALDDESGRRAIGEELVDALVEVHAVTWEACGLEGYGKPTGYLDRQLRRFGGLWEHNRTREIALVDRLTEWLTENKPESGEATIVHGDYRLGNTMYAPGAPARLIAIFDWELATIGDPLADIGYLLATWAQPGDAENAISRARRHHARARVPDPRRARRALRAGLRAVDERRPLVHDARALEVRDLPRGQLQAPARRHHRRPVLRPARDGRPRHRGARVAGRTGLIVDFGGVLTTDVFASFRKFCDARGARSRHRPRPLPQRPRGAPPAGGARDRPDARGGVRAGVRGRARGRPERLIDRMFGGMEPDAAMVEGVRAARAAGVRTGLLSNSWGDDRYDREQLAELFDAWVISGEVGLRKPDPAIYELAAERLGLAPEQCVFVDDLPGNLKPARALGMATVVHRGDAAATLAELSRAARRQPALIATTPTSVIDDAQLLRARDALGEHDAGEQHGDRRVERADHGDDAQQALLRREREERGGEEVERADEQQRRAVAQAVGQRRAHGERQRAEQRHLADAHQQAAPTARPRPRSRCRAARRSCRSRARRAARGRSRRGPPARARTPSRAGSRAASTMPTIASAIPTIWIVPGRSPEATPTSTGTAAPVADTGATMLIVPIASPR